MSPPPLADGKASPDPLRSVQSVQDRSSRSLAVALEAQLANKRFEESALARCMVRCRPLQG